MKKRPGRSRRTAQDVKTMNTEAVSMLGNVKKKSPGDAPSTAITPNVTHAEPTSAASCSKSQPKVEIGDSEHAMRDSAMPETSLKLVKPRREYRPAV